MVSVVKETSFKNSCVVSPEKVIKTMWTILTFVPADFVFVKKLPKIGVEEVKLVEIVES